MLYFLRFWLVWDLFLLVFLRCCKVLDTKSCIFLCFYLFGVDFYLFSLWNTTILLPSIGFPKEMHYFCSQTLVFLTKYNIFIKNNGLLRKYNLFTPTRWLSFANATFFTSLGKYIIFAPNLCFRNSIALECQLSNGNTSSLFSKLWKSSRGSVPSYSLHILLHSYLKVMRNALLAPFPPPVIHFLLHPYLKMMRNALLAPFPPSVFISYYILMQNDEKCSPRSLSSSSVHFSLHSY